MSSIKAVIFDLDGTLVNSTPSHISAWLEASRIIGLTNIRRSHVDKLMGRTSYDIARELLQIANKPTSLAHKLAKIKDELFIEKYTDQVEVIDNADQVLRTLKSRGLKICVVSSNPRELILKVLKNTGLAKYVDSVVGQDEVIKGKPDPEPILLALRRLSVRPNEAIVVGDSEYDIIAAKRAGVKSIGVSKNSSKRTKLAKCGALATVDALSDIIGVIEELLIE